MAHIARHCRLLALRTANSLNSRVACASLHGSPTHRAKDMTKMTEEFDAPPVKYTTSKAHDYSSFESFEKPQRDWPWYQPWSVIATTVVLLVYFCILREENEIDQEMAKTLYQRIPGLEEAELRAAINHAHRNGRDTTDLRQRLKDVLAEGQDTRA